MDRRPALRTKDAKLVSDRTLNLEGKSFMIFLAYRHRSWDRRCSTAYLWLLTWMLWPTGKKSTRYPFGRKIGRYYWPLSLSVNKESRNADAEMPSLF